MSDLPTELIAWIKRQRQNEEALRKERAVTRQYKEDKTFLEYVTVIAQKCWPRLKAYERKLMMSLVEQHKSHRNLSMAQRSAIIGIYLNYGGKW